MVRPITPSTSRRISPSREGGFATPRHVQWNGECRKLTGATMCPSYMATRDEKHSTRGRANALRAILSGRLPQAELTSHGLHDALDLCLECKACKTECPSNVDMAKLKYEFLSHYYARHGTPLRAKLFAHIATINRLGQMAAPLARWLARSALGKGPATPRHCRSACCRRLPGNV